MTRAHGLVAVAPLAGSRVGQTDGAWKNLEVDASRPGLRT